MCIFSNVPGWSALRTERVYHLQFSEEFQTVYAEGLALAKHLVIMA